MSLGSQGVWWFNIGLAAYLTTRRSVHAFEEPRLKSKIPRSSVFFPFPAREGDGALRGGSGWPGPAALPLRGEPALGLAVSPGPHQLPGMGVEAAEIPDCLSCSELLRSV